VIKVSNLIEDIAFASADQAQGIKQISQAVSEMDNLVRTNVSETEETAHPKAPQLELRTEGRMPNALESRVIDSQSDV
jgi:hypothetical protein